MARAFESVVNHFFFAKNARELFRKQLVLDGRNVAIFTAILDQKWRIVGRDEVAGIGQRDLFGNRLDRCAEESGFWRTGVVGVRGTTARTGLFLHFEEIDGAKPIDHRLHATRLIGVSEFGTFELRDSARGAEQ